jgi:hypothetical protein
MRFRVVVAVMHVIVTVGQYNGPAGGSSTAGERTEGAEGTEKIAGADHGGTE